MLEMNSSSNSRYESNYKNFVESFNEGVEFLKYDTMKDKGLFSKRDLSRRETRDEMKLIDNFLFMLDILYPVGEGGDNLLNYYLGELLFFDRPPLI